MSTNPHPKTCAMLKAAGIDYQRVMVDGFNLTGYNFLVLTEDGNRIHDNETGGAKVTRESWPSPEFAKRVLDVFKLEHAAVFDLEDDS